MQHFDFHTHKKDAENAVINLFDDEKTGDQNYYSIGLHPMDIANKDIDKAMEKLEKVAVSKSIVAIGECGFDKNVNAHLELQEKVFIRHCKISEEIQKPMIIHCVGYYDKLIKIIKKEDPRQNQAVHAYNKKNVIILRKLIQAGFYVSLAWQAVFDSSKLELLLPEIPQNRLFLETDDTDSHTIDEIYRIVANQLEISPEKLNQIINDNFRNFRFMSRDYIN